MSSSPLQPSRTSQDHAARRRGGGALAPLAARGGGRATAGGNAADRTVGARKGKPCPSPAVKGKRRCRMHGGAHGSGAPMGKRNGNYRHGYYTYKAIAERRALTALIRNDLVP
jgi:hypothetical protein